MVQLNQLNSVQTARELGDYIFAEGDIRRHEFMQGEPLKQRYLNSRTHRITPNPRRAKIKVLDTTPHFLRRYALNDKQILLAILRHNQLIGMFLGVSCYSLQSNLRTTVRGLGQTETDEVYIGLDQQWRPVIIPVQAKGKNDQVGIVQIEQDMEKKASIRQFAARPRK